MNKADTLDNGVSAILSRIRPQSLQPERRWEIRKTVGTAFKNILIDVTNFFMMLSVPTPFSASFFLINTGYNRKPDITSRQNDYSHLRNRI